MTNKDSFDDYYAGGLGDDEQIVTTKQAAAATTTRLDPAYGYAGSNKLANPFQRLAVFAIDFAAYVGFPLVVATAVLPHFMTVPGSLVLLIMALWLVGFLGSVNFFDQGVGFGQFLVKVRPVHAVAGTGTHGVTAVHPLRLCGHALLSVLDTFFFIGLVRIFVTRTHQTFADKMLHVVWVPFDYEESGVSRWDWGRWNYHSRHDLPSKNTERSWRYLV